MLHKFLLTILIGQIAFLGLSNFVPLVSAAQINTDYLFGGNVTNVQKLSEQSGLGLQDPRETAAKVVNVILGFLGIIAVVLILIAGFLWMTAAGSEEKIATAKKLMSAGVIGLVIVLAAFGIARFVISSMLSATGGDSSGGGVAEAENSAGAARQKFDTVTRKVQLTENGLPNADEPAHDDTTLSEEKIFTNVDIEIISDASLY